MSVENEMEALMEPVNKLILGTAVGVGLIATVSYFTRMRRAQVQLEVIPKASIHSLSLSGLKIRVDAVLKNPGAAQFSIKFPYLRISHSGVTLGSSQVIDKDILIPAYGEVVIDGMMIEVGTFSFLSVAYNVVRALNNSEPVKLLAQIITTIDLGWSRIPYESKQEIVLKK